MNWNVIEKLLVTFSVIFIIDFRHRIPEMNSLGEMSQFSPSLVIFPTDIFYIETRNEFCI